MSQPSKSLTRELLARAHSPDSAQRIYADKIEKRPLFLRPNSPPPSDARSARRKAREAREQRKRKKALKPKPLSARERRCMGVHNVPKERQKYDLYVPLHRLWLGYVREQLGGDVYVGGPNTAAKLTSADFHGALVEVSRSGCPSRVGIKGIVIKDTQFTFEIVTPKNKLKTIPKEGTIFRVNIPVDQTPEPATGGVSATAAEEPKDNQFTFELHGEQFKHRAADRSSKKLKPHFLKHL